MGHALQSLFMESPEWVKPHEISDTEKPQFRLVQKKGAGDGEKTFSFECYEDGAQQRTFSTTLTMLRESRLVSVSNTCL
jgi:hypothetical protein